MTYYGVYYRCDTETCKCVMANFSTRGTRQDFLAWLDDHPNYYEAEAECKSKCCGGETHWVGYRCTTKTQTEELGYKPGCYKINFTGTRDKWLAEKARIPTWDTKAGCMNKCHTFSKRAKDDIACSTRVFEGTPQEFTAFLAADPLRFATEAECKESSIIRAVYYQCMDGTCLKLTLKTVDQGAVDRLYATPGIYKTLAECQAICKIPSSGLEEDFPYHSSATGQCIQHTFTGTLAQYTAFLTDPDAHATLQACAMALQHGDHWYEDGTQQRWFPLKFFFMIFGNFFNRG